MKKLVPFILLTLLAACNNTAEHAQEITHFYAPEPGTVVASDSFKIQEDDLNNFYYVAKIISTDSSDKGYYFLDANWGLYDAKTELVYPALQEEIIPAIERDRTEPYVYILGFKYRHNDTFHDYAKLTATRSSPLKSQLELKYLKSYYIDSVETK